MTLWVAVLALWIAVLALAVLFVSLRRRLANRTFVAESEIKRLDVAFEILEMQRKELTELRLGLTIPTVGHLP
jgi:hypothetical protein